MAKTAEERVQPRVRGRGRRRSVVDSRQMELFSASALEPTHPLLSPRIASEIVSYHADLIETAKVDAQRVQAHVPCKIETRPVVANDQIDSEAQALFAIVDLLLDLWQEATGEDLRSSIFEAQNL